MYLYFFRFFIRKNADRTVAISSATMTDAHMPSVPRNRGMTITAMIWNTRVLIKEIIADTTPLFRAVKKPEENMANPANRNTKE